MKINILPITITNEFRGNRISLWAFYIYAAYTVIRGLLHSLLPDGGSKSIASIPIDTYSSEAAMTVISIFAMWGLSQLLFGLLNVIVAFRYKMLIPLMYLFAIADMIGRIIIINLKPLQVTEVAPGGIGSYILLPILVVLFFLSVYIKEEK